ncbi:unnamed protein product [Amoebophrya sp. A25]|nr:unnamed protein product [Amoebophrya sp. A25]|eukprot:GSA25T00005175001.1
MDIAQKRFELENAVVESDWTWDEDAADELYHAAPWKQDPHFFRQVRISAVALLKMVMHARSGGNIEIMGLMQGKATADGKFVVMDAFPLPVEGTETRVQAGNAANEFMCMFKELSEQIGKQESIMGWYHSHPGYRPWLSGIDVSTQRLYQKHQEPFLAVVIDPHRTCAAGKVDIGAFRTYSEEHAAAMARNGGAASSSSSRGSGLPLEKIQDFGVHANEYYPIPIEYFKSKTDSAILATLWERYWQETLSANPLTSNVDQTTQEVREISSKLSMCPLCRPLNMRESRQDGDSAGAAMGAVGGPGNSSLVGVAQDGAALSVDLLQGMLTHVSKFVLFQTPTPTICPPAY